jgi:CheY-like chemotaxis protein
MEPFEVFEQNLHEVLNHLYDPVFRPPEPLWKALNIDRDRGLPALRDAVLSGIEELKPTAQVPLTARSWRIYGMLRYRYVDGLPQEATAEKLGITARHLRRSFAEAIHALSMVLWEKTNGTLPQSSTILHRGEDVNPQAPHAAPRTPETDVTWHEQLVRELEALEETAGGAVANVAETLTGVIRLAMHLTRERDISLHADPISSRLMAAIHPSALRHILISIIDQLARQMTSGAIRLSASQGGGEVHICVTGAPVTATAFDDFEPIGTSLSSFDITLSASLQNSDLELSMTLLQVDRCVLAVDDNMDMAHLYRRYLAGTRYYLQHVDRGEKTFEAVALYQPDLVVLDVMLPDVDGWDLLTRLHENQDTRRLPVLICSVMREKELAQALGASYFLAKPVQRQDFLQALDAILQ